MRVLRRLILTASAIGLGFLGLTPSALAVPAVSGTQDPTLEFVASGRSGKLTLGTGWSALRRVEVWAFRASAFSGTPQHGSSLLRWDAGAGGLAAPELPLPVLDDGSYYLTVIGYLQTTPIISEEPIPPSNVTCRYKDRNLRNGTSDDTEYCAFDMVVFDNLVGSLRCASGSCVTSTSMPGAIVPETGWWWNPGESGRGILIEESKGTLFLTFQLYDGNGSATWYLASGAITAGGAFSAPLQQFTGGQTLTGAYVAPTLLNGNVGTLGLQFSGSGNGVMTLPDGRQVAIQRFRF